MRGLGAFSAVRRGRRSFALAFATVVAALVIIAASGIHARLAAGLEGAPASPRLTDELAEVGREAENFARFGRPAVLEQARVVMAIETTLGRAYLWSAPTTSGGRCVYVQLDETTDRGQSHVTGLGPCFMRQPTDPLQIAFAGGRRDGTGIVAGRVGAETTTLELRFADGSAAPVESVHGLFLFETPERKGTALVGRDASGAVVARARMPRPSPPDPTLDASYIQPR